MILTSSPNKYFRAAFLFALVQCLGFLPLNTFAQKSKPSAGTSSKPTEPARKKPAYKPSYTRPETVVYNEPETVAFRPLSFVDHFDDNSNNWALVDDDGKQIKVNSGKLVAKGLKNLNFQSIRSFDIRRNEDFYCELTVKWLAGSTNNGFGIRYNAEGEPCNDFVISADGHYKVMYYQSDWIDIKSWEKSSYINNNSLANKLGIEKRGRTINYYINGNKVATAAADHYFGGWFGITFNNAQTVEFDDFILKRIDASFTVPTTAASGAFYYKADFSVVNDEWAMANDANKEMSNTGGRFFMKGLKDLNFQSVKNFQINTENDFYCAVNVKWVSGINNHGFGLRYCSAPEKFNDFQISSNGFYKMMYFEGKWEDASAWTKSDYIYQGSMTNLLEIEKKGKFISYSINKHIVAVLPHSNNFGGWFGFTLDNQQGVEFDNFILKEGRSPSAEYTQASSRDFYYADNFSDNTGNWSTVKDGNKETGVSAGKLTIKGLASFNFQNKNQFEIDIEQDFYATVLAKWSGGANNSGFGMRYCSSADVYNDFIISQDGFYKISYFKDNKWTDVRAWTKSEYVKQASEQNILSIERKGSNISYFINGNKVETLYFSNNFGSWFGITTNNAQTVEFDNFVLRGTKSAVGKL